MLLAMTSGTAALYVGNKVAHRNAPEITSISPRTVTPGDTVTILGSNFDPADRNDRERRITLNISGYERTLYVNVSSDSRVLFEVPHDVPAEHRTLTLISSAGVETVPQDIEILSGEVRFLEAIPPELVHGTTIVIKGQNFRTDVQPRVTVAGIPAAEPTVQPGGRVLTFTAPALPDSTGTTAELIISFPNRADAVQTLPIGASGS